MARPIIFARQAAKPASTVTRRSTWLDPADTIIIMTTITPGMTMLGMTITKGFEKTLNRVFFYAVHVSHRAGWRLA
jgi:hypothetical protein